MKFLILFFTFSFLASCECEMVSTGFVLDAHTGEPIDSVEVKVYIKRKNKSSEVYRKGFTDSAGYFETGGIYGSGFRDCPDMISVFSKPGYQTQEAENVWKDTIMLIK